jgi:hypothetical protein
MFESLTGEPLAEADAFDLDGFLTGAPQNLVMTSELLADLLEQIGALELSPAESRSLEHRLVAAVASPSMPPELVRSLLESSRRVRSGTAVDATLR